MRIWGFQISSRAAQLLMIQHVGKMAVRDRATPRLLRRLRGAVGRDRRYCRHQAMHANRYELVVVERHRSVARTATVVTVIIQSIFLDSELCSGYIRVMQKRARRGEQGLGVEA